MEGQVQSENEGNDLRRHVPRQRLDRLATYFSAGRRYKFGNGQLVDVGDLVGVDDNSKGTGYVFTGETAKV